ncbi:hypothetical protein [Phascolarctobacterium faecium]|uniref:hypothetical protein n=1 Tax=Phascolarctobacterium faecium TaxID=33025 RepID=UPI0030798D77
MEKKEKSPADRQGENRRMLVHTDYKTVCETSKNRVNKSITTIVLGILREV